MMNVVMTPSHGSRRAAHLQTENNMEEMAAAPWAMSPDDVVRNFRTNLSQGLSSVEVRRRLAHFGTNELPQPTKKPTWKLVAEQFDDALVKVLLVAAIISFVLAFNEQDPNPQSQISQYIEPVVILLILCVNAIIGSWQENDAEKALDALKGMQTATSVCLRDGEWHYDLEAKNLVPGDVIYVSAGSKVPADARLVHLKTASLKAEQASLTGESVSISKSIEAVQEQVDLQGKESMIFAGTSISHGHGLAVITHTGIDTEIGKIQKSITSAENEEQDTILKKKLNDFANTLTKGIGVICFVVWLINYRFFLSWETFPDMPYLPNPLTIKVSLSQCTYYFKIAVALAVAAIPEGLPAVITTCLALGTRKLARRSAIIRKLHSIETLGCTSVICSDKTGTLTKNEMAVNYFALPAYDEYLREYHVTGNSMQAYEPSGDVLGLSSEIDPALQAFCTICALCNLSKLDCKAGSYRVNGEPTEGALKVLVEKIGAPHPEENAKIQEKRNKDPSRHVEAVCECYRKNYNDVAVLELDRKRKSMSIIVNEVGKEQNILLAKGAPESLLRRCSAVLLPGGDTVQLSKGLQERAIEKVKLMSEQGLRCLALAIKRDLGELATNHGSASENGYEKLKNPSNFEEIESDMTFVGLVGMEDPPRPDVKASVERCRTAGIKVAVITGDKRETAESICRKIGVFGHEEDLRKKSFTGQEFFKLSDEERRAVLAKGSNEGLLFSRSEPADKLKIIDMFGENGEVVAMTGDGVNDAPALKKSHIGIAMGRTGTEVAKEASEMVLADENFSTIVAAVEEGRSIYDNMKAFIRYMISSNVGEVVSIFLTAALGIPEGLNPVQLLWVNLVTDGPPATALSFNPPDPGVMKRPPRRGDEPLTTTAIFLRYLVIGSYVGIATVGIFVVWYTRLSFGGIDLSQDGHTAVSFAQLRTWHECSEWPGFKANEWSALWHQARFGSQCDYFREGGKAKASTLSLTVLVVIEMLNSLNAVSETSSLLVAPPWRNPYLLLAVCGSLLVHCAILYVPILSRIFSTVPLSANEWLLVLAFSFPVIIIEEVFKLFQKARPFTAGA